jgi:arabinofuranosyltransferase
MERTEDRARIALILATGALLLLGAAYIVRTSFELGDRRVFCLWDDAMISMTYARNWVEGHGLVWNPGGERVQGFSNLGVTLAMAAVHGLPLAPEHTSLAFQLLCLACLVATLLAVARVAGRDDPWQGVAAANFTLFAAPLAIWSLQGSDAAPIALWLIACAGVLAQPSPRPAWVAGLAAGALLRPDAGLFFAAALAARATCTPRPRAALIAGALALAASAAAYLLFGWLYYGDPLPNTWYLKATGMPRALIASRGLRSLGIWLPGVLPALAAWLIAVALAPRDRLLRIASACLVAGLVYEVSVGGDWIVKLGSRFLAPLLPLLGLCTARGLALGFTRLPPRYAPAAMMLGGLLCGYAASPKAAATEWLLPREPTLLADYNRANWRLGAYLRDHADPSLRVAVHWAGVVPYVSRRPAIDVLGKSDRHIARLRVDRFEPGHAKWDWDYVLETQRPDVFDAPSRGLERDARFLRDFVRVSGPDGVAFYLRRGAAGLLHDLPDGEIRGNP